MNETEKNRKFILELRWLRIKYIMQSLGLFGLITLFVTFLCYGDLIAGLFIAVIFSLCFFGLILIAYDYDREELGKEEQ